MRWWWTIRRRKIKLVEGTPPCARCSVGLRNGDKTGFDSLVCRKVYDNARCFRSLLNSDQVPLDLLEHGIHAQTHVWLPASTPAMLERPSPAITVAVMCPSTPRLVCVQG